MSTKHTPGPWSADKWAPGWTVSAPESHYSICHLEDCNNEEANAKLIAAAPALLEQLQTLVDDARLVVERWEEGELADAVNILEGSAESAEELLATFS